MGRSKAPTSARSTNECSIKNQGTPGIVPKVNDIRARLKGGDLRSLGDSHELVEDVSEHPEMFGDLFANLFDADRLVRMRAADAVEKVTRERPQLLQPWKGPLLEQISAIEDKEVRWHVAQMLPRLSLTSG